MSREWAALRPRLALARERRFARSSERVFEGAEGEQRVVDSAEPIAGNDDGFAFEGDDKVEHGIIFAERDKQTARAFDEKSGAME